MNKTKLKYILYYTEQRLCTPELQLRQKRKLFFEPFSTLDFWMVDKLLQWRPNENGFEKIKNLMRCVTATD